MIRKHLVFTLIIIGITSLLEINGQRSPYAGSRPSGYKDRFKPEVAGTGNGSDVVNRLGESSSTTDRLPYDAYGDAALVHHYNQLPEDKRPYWLINQEHIEAQRGTPAAGGTLNAQRPQTAAQATANANTNTNSNTNNNSNVASRFGENDKNAARPAGRRPSEENIYDHNLISQQPVVYPVNIPEDQRQQMEAIVREQQRQAVTQRQNSNQNSNSNENLNSNSNRIQNQQQPQISYPVPLANPQRGERFSSLPERRLPLFQPLPENDFRAPPNSNSNENLNSNSNRIQNQQQPQISYPVPLANPQRRGERFLPLPERRFPLFQPLPENDFRAPPNSFGIAPYFVDYD